ncbi:hypothetical protein [Notoacmeibacter sp. MSK16QG-6]|uniref:hypothetical protein n=1 Tax=Notoacmeibacter sp. MSK16QG-6 TaxID=2957982 RepID=UPI00209D49DC|nr:hypothetical protein [Notoacmeibacter sp. MSK16QG-6]MCP1200138.1 hypothetical protein [Notoacmeibacter sp. MSK16QG-6]
MLTLTRLTVCAALLSAPLATPAFALDGLEEKMIDRPPDNYIAVQEAQQDERERLAAAGSERGKELMLSSFTGKTTSSNAVAKHLKAAQSADEPQGSGPTDLFSRLEGKWSGKGDTYLDRLGKELSVSCDFSIDRKQTDVSLEGECGALFLKRAIGIQLNPKDGGKIDGTYLALKEGPTRLEGQLTAPDTMSLTMHWPKVVMGDRIATMKLIRTGPDSFRQIVSDKQNGKERVTSDITFERKI